jgi:early secretory antigenic target protein ESAT-6
MSDRIVVNFHQLHTASDHIATAVATLNSELAELERAAAPLVETWGGTAKEAYEQRQATWRTAARDLADVLGQIKRAVDDSAADYANTEQRNTNLFR